MNELELKTVREMDLDFDSKELESKVNEIFNQTNLSDSSSIINYGIEAQKKLSNFSTTALQNIKTSDLGEVGELLSDVLVNLKEIDMEEVNKKGLFSRLFKKTKINSEKLVTQFKSAQSNVDGIVKSLENHQMTLINDIALMDKLYETNNTYFRDLTIYIIAGKRRLEYERDTILQELLEKAEENKDDDISTEIIDYSQKAKDLDDKLIRFEKKISDLETTRYIAMQTALQIKLIQNNDIVLVEKIKSTIVNTIPLWKSQILLGLGINHSANAVKSTNEVTEFTNKMLQYNSKMLKESTIATAKEAERGIVDIEVLKSTNKDLIETLDEISNIQQEGRAKRIEAEKELHSLENELKDKLIIIKNGSNNDTSSTYVNIDNF